MMLPTVGVLGVITPASTPAPAVPGLAAPPTLFQAPKSSGVDAVPVPVPAETDGRRVRSEK